VHHSCQPALVQSVRLIDSLQIFMVEKGDSITSLLARFSGG